MLLGRVSEDLCRETENVAHTRLKLRQSSRFYVVEPDIVGACVRDVVELPRITS
jgi:hypothetical protein